MFEINVLTDTFTGRPGGATGKEFADYIMDTIKDPDLEKRWQSYQ